MASEDKDHHAASSSSEEEHPVEAGELMVIETLADDDEDAELYVLPNGIGAISLNLPQGDRRDYGFEDEEVVVIEGEGRPDVVRGEFDIWIRGRQQASWRTGAAVDEIPDSPVGQFGFEDEDEVATEVARFSTDGRLRSYRRVNLSQNDEEDEEIIIPSHQTVPPGTRADGEEESEEDWDPEEGQTRIIPGRELELAARRGTADLRFTAPTMALPRQEPRPGGPETLVLEGRHPARPPAESLSASSGPIPPEKEPAVSASECVDPDEEKTQISRDPATDDIPLEFLEEGVRRDSVVSGSGAEEPVARLAPTPARPLSQSKAPPRVDRPVPNLPGVRASGQATSPSTSAPAAKLKEGARPGSMKAPFGKGAAASGPVAETPRAYFARPDRAPPSLKGPLVVGGVLLLLMFALGYAWMTYQRSEALEALRSEILAALAEGNKTELIAAREAVLASQHHSEASIKALNTWLTWRLWAGEGLKSGDEVPDAAALEEIRASDPLPLVLARAERDLYIGDHIRGEQVVKLATELNPNEPMLVFMLGRFALTKADEGLEQVDRAEELLSNALKLLGEQGATVPVSKAMILTELARAGAIRQRAGAVNLFDAAIKAEPDYLWATVWKVLAIRSEDSDYAIRDAELKALLDRLGERLSPRQRATIQVARAREAMKAGKDTAALRFLQDARIADPGGSEAQRLLGQYYLDQGKLGRALPYLKAAYTATPLNLKVAATYVEGLLANTKLADARDVIRNVPPVYQEKPYARLIKARIQRAIEQYSSAESQILAALRLLPDNFDFKLEQAMILLAQEKDDAASLFDALLENAPGAGRAYLEPVLQALRTASTSGWKQQRWKSRALENGGENALVLLLLAEIDLTANRKTAAKGLLEKASRYGDLPRIDLLLARIGGQSSSTREEALKHAQKVLGGCGEGPMCDEATHLVERLQ